MAIDHSNCTHPRTPAGRRACRAGKAPVTTPANPLVRKVAVSRETSVPDRSDRVAPTRAMAELLGMRAPERPADVGWLSTQGYERNGGFIVSGQEWRPASTGSNKNKKREIKKATVDGGVERDDAGKVINDKGRGGLPVTTPGIYLHPGTGVKYQVKLGRESHKPFAVTLDGEYAKGIVFELRARDKVDEVAIPGLGLSVPKKVELELGFYEMAGEIYNVKRSKSTSFLFALHITDDCPKGERAPGVVKQLTPEMKLSQETAAQYGIRTGTCCICGRELTRDESIARGIGPVCFGKMGW
jgi:hypothetical protein